MTTTTVLITGANRGIGRGLAESFLSRPNHTVFAAVRDFDSPTAKSLLAFPTAKGSSVRLVKIENTSDTDPLEAAKTIQAAGVDHLDLVIANAALMPVNSRIESNDLDELRKQYEANFFSVVKLFQAVYPLLKQTADAKGQPKFVGLSSEAASIHNLESNTPYLLGSYGSAKCAVNYIVRRAQFENPWLTAFTVNPGFAQTDMGNIGAKAFGLEKAFVPIDVSVKGLLQHIDNATRDKVSGKFLSFDGTEMAF